MATAASRVEFDGNVFGLGEELGRLVVPQSIAGISSLPVLAHASGMTPVVRVGGKESSEEVMFDCPFEVAVDYQTGNIYVSYWNNNRVYVFDANGEYLYKFGDKKTIPYYISISENRVFVSQLDSNCVSIHDLNGTLITQFGDIRESQLNDPIGIAINEMNGDIYVCDSSNDSIQMFCKELPFNSQFGHEILKRPRNIKLTNDYIYVLSCYDPFLCSFTYTYDFTQTHNTAISSISKHLNDPHALCIDGSGHFIISDYLQDAILIFNQQGKLIRTITDSVYSPFGVTLDSIGRILVVGYNHSLLIS